MRSNVVTRWALHFGWWCKVAPHSGFASRSSNSIVSSVVMDKRGYGYSFGFIKKHNIHEALARAANIKALEEHRRSPIRTYYDKYISDMGKLVKNYIRVGHIMYYQLLLWADYGKYIHPTRRKNDHVKYINLLIKTIEAYEIEEWNAEGTSKEYY